MDKNSLPYTEVESKSNKRSIDDLFEEIKKKDFGSLKLMSNYRNEDFVQKLIGFKTDRIPYKNEEISASKIKVKFSDGDGAANLLNNENMKQWTCENFKTGETKLKFTFTEPQQLHFYSFTTAF